MSSAVRRLAEPGGKRRLLALSACALSACALAACVPAQDPQPSYEMATHYRVALQLQDAVIRGDMEAAHERGGQIASMEIGSERPGQSGRHGERIQERGARIAEAESVDEAAAALARIAEECGACHVATGGGPVLRDEPRWADVPGIESRMHRHGWAADRMWEGLVTPSDTAWFVGALELTTTPFTPERTPKIIAEAELTGLTDRVHRLGLEALRASDAGDRTERAIIYGQLLGTCGRCHAKLDGGVRSDRPPP